MTLTAALQLLQTDVVAGALGSGGGGGGADLGAARTQAHRMIGVCGLLTGAVRVVEEIAQAGTTLHLLLRVYKPNQPHSGVVGNRILQITRELARSVNGVRRELWESETSPLSDERRGRGAAASTLEMRPSSYKTRPSP